MIIENAAQDAARDAVRVVDATLRKAWTIMDAAHEKPAPSQYLKPDAIRAVQGQ